MDAQNQQGNIGLEEAVKLVILRSDRVPEDVAWICDATDLMLSEVQFKQENLEWHCRWFDIYSAIREQPGDWESDWRAVHIAEVLFRLRFALSMLQGFSGVSFELSGLDLAADLPVVANEVAAFVAEQVHAMEDVEKWLVESLLAADHHWFVRSEFMLLPRSLAYRILMYAAGGVLDRLHRNSNGLPIPVEEIAQIHFYGAPATLGDHGNARALAQRMFLANRKLGSVRSIFRDLDKNFDWVQSLTARIRVLPSLRIRVARSWVRFLSFVGTIEYLNQRSGANRWQISKWMIKYMQRSLTPTAFLAGRPVSSVILAALMKAQRLLHNRLLLGIVSVTLRDGRRITGELILHTDPLVRRKVQVSTRSFG
jgi:hypothetical protein